MPVGTLTSKGQITIPRAVRERLGVSKGDRLEFLFDELGRLIVRPEGEGPLGRLPGMLRHLAPEQPISVEGMREAVLQRANAKHGVRKRE